MGIYDVLQIEQDVNLEQFDHDPREIPWQTKSLGQPAALTYKLADDRLYLQKQTYREMEGEELDEYVSSRTNGEHDSWEEWVDSDGMMPIPSWKKTVDEQWWVDMQHRGSFEFHYSVDDVYYSYEARFSGETLDEILLLESKDISSNRPNTEV